MESFFRDRTHYYYYCCCCCCLRHGSQETFNQLHFIALAEGHMIVQIIEGLRNCFGVYPLIEWALVRNFAEI